MKRARAEVVDAELLTSYQHSLAKFKQRKVVKGDREKDVMARLKTFTTMLKKKPAMATAIPEGGVLASLSVSVQDTVKGGETSDPSNSKAVDGVSGYDGKVNKEMDHRTYLPAAWRVSHSQ